MATTYTQVPPDSTGDKLHMIERIRGADTVLVQSTALDIAPTYMGWANDVAPAASKHMITLFNTAASGVVVEVYDLRYVLLQTAAVTGVVLRWDIVKCSTSTVGSLLTAEQLDSGAAALPAGVTVRTGATAATGNRLGACIVSGEEFTTVLSNVSGAAGVDLLPGLKNLKAKPLVLREGQGISVLNITSSTVGTFGLQVTFGVHLTYTAD